MQSITLQKAAQPVVDSFDQTGSLVDKRGVKLRQRSPQTNRVVGLLRTRNPANADQHMTRAINTTVPAPNRGIGRLPQRRSGNSAARAIEFCGRGTKGRIRGPIWDI